MGRHTTPGAPAPRSRDDVVGWGAFATGLAAVLVGLTAGRVHGVTVALLGALTTAALWVVRNGADGGLGRGRHASDTPWSPSDLLELKEQPVERPGRRSAAAPADGTAAGPAGGSADGLADGLADGSADGSAGGSADGIAAGLPEAPAERSADLPSRAAGRRGGRRRAERTPLPDDDPFGWLPGATPAAAPATVVTPEDAPPPGRRAGRRRAASPPDAPPGDIGADGTQTPSPFGSVPFASVPSGSVPSAAPAAPAAPDPGTGAGTAMFAGVAAVAPAPAGRRSRRAAAAPPVLPVAPFDVGGAVAVPAARDPLAGPVDPSTVAAEPAVLDPALDALWVAPVLDLTAEQQPALPGGPDLPSVPAVPSVPSAPSVQSALPPHDREREAAAIDPHWARRARRPDPPRRAGSRPAVTRREPAPAVLQPLPRRAPAAPAAAVPVQQHPAPADRDEDTAELPPRAPAAAEAAPFVVVLPEPDVPDLLMLPEQADGPGEPSAADAAGVPTSRPAPGTMSLDELLVLHTRRPQGRRSGSDARAGDGTDRRLE